MRTSELSDLNEGEIEIIQQTGTGFANYNRWLFDLSKESFGTVLLEDLTLYDSELRDIFSAVTYERDGQRYFNELYDVHSVNSQVRLAFSIKRRLETEAEVVPQAASLLIIDKLSPVKKNDKLYPSAEDSAKIIELDDSDAPLELDLKEIEASYQVAKKALDDQGLGHMLTFDLFKRQNEHSKTVKQKERSFHYLPYNFEKSKLELDILKQTLCLSDVKDKDLEIYFNGERGLTEFVINCFAKTGKFWKNIGKYTTDFLILQRRDKSIHKALILETKGKGYSNDPVFLEKKRYVETEFLQQNNDKFGYERFDFLYLEDSADMTTNLSTLSDRINSFFKD